MSYKTVLKETISEIEIEKSRFICHMIPAGSENEATGYIERIRKKHYNATHNVPVYLIGDQYAIQKYSDDGEPSGTAGLPVLEMLKKEGFTNICLVITRYFGGTKLGKGGLVRAYTQSAKSALEEAQILEFKECAVVGMTMDYGNIGKVENYLKKNDRIFLSRVEYLQDVYFELVMDIIEYEPFVEEITQMSNATILVELVSKEMISTDTGKLIKEDFYAKVD